VILMSISSAGFDTLLSWPHMEQRGFSGVSDGWLESAGWLDGPVLILRPAVTVGALDGCGALHPQSFCSRRVRSPQSLSTPSSVVCPSLPALPSASQTPHEFHIPCIRWNASGFVTSPKTPAGFSPHMLQKGNSVRRTLGCWASASTVAA
jgi:hypothetical protein